MQHRPVRYYITQDDDQAVVRSVPMTRRAQTMLPSDERTTKTTESQAVQEATRPSVTNRVMQVVRRSGGGRK